MPRTLVGLDIGSSGVRAAEFVLGRRKATLRRFATLPLPHGVVSAGAVVDSEALTQTLRDLWSEGHFSTKAAALGIANTSLLVRQMDLDWMPPADFRQALRYQVEDSLPIPVDDANLDYHLLDDLEVTGEGDKPRRVQRILLVAAARSMVDGFVEATHQAGLRTTSVDILPFALIRARMPAGVDDTHEVEAIVDIGAETVTVVVHAGGVPRYVRMIPDVGGESITQAVRQRFDWTWEEAERTKIGVGLPGHASLPPEQLTGLATPVHGLDHPAQEQVSAAVDILIDEVSTTLDYYRGSTTGAATAEDPSAVARVLLAGKGARLGGLTERLHERLGLPVEALSVVEQVRVARGVDISDEDTVSLVVPAGLCLAGGR